MALASFPWLLAILLLLYGVVVLSTLSDWPGSIGAEGLLTYGAERMRRGEWPYRDFLFLSTPGALWIHWLAQAMGASRAGERILPLLASTASVALVWAEVQAWIGSWKERLVLAALLLAWSFPLWNMADAAWYAVFLVLAGLRLRNWSWVVTGLCFAAAGFCKLELSIAAAAGLLLALGAYRSWKPLLLFAAAYFAGAALLVGALFLQGGLSILNAARGQLLFGAAHEVFPGVIPAERFGPPLLTLGLWLGSLYLSRAAAGTVRLARLAAVAFAAYAIRQGGQDYFAALFVVLSLLAWLGSLLFLFRERAAERKVVLFFWLPGAGVIASLFPHLTFAHFLFAWPLSAALLVWFLGRIPRRYPSTFKPWVLFPVWLLLLGGGIFQGRLLFTRLFGEVDAAGWTSYGAAHQLNSEMGEAAKLLSTQGLSPGGPLLVLGNAPSFYRAMGFRNPTAHQQFLPGYVEAAGSRPQDVLVEFEGKGGHFVVTTRDANLAAVYPEIERQLQEHFVELRRFPLYFSVWKLRDPL